MTYDLLMLMFDDPHAEEVEHYLTSKQIKVVREHTVKKAIQCIRYNSYHFVLLAQRLEGADFLMDIVYQGYYGIYTYLIAAGEFRHAEERAAVLRSGADVCICAPVSPDELYEQISAVTRRQHRQMRHSLAGPSSLPILKFTNLSIDPIRNAVMSSGREIHCTPKEFDVLYLLATYAGHICSAQYIYENVWKAPFIHSGTSIPDCISALRRRLGSNSGYIETVYGRGYRFIDFLEERRR